jgi:aryl-alcohol dehydrogenase-like predicted oxidoreductase
MRALTDAVKAGKTRWLGFSEWPMDKIEAALAMPGVEKFVSSQPQYSLLHRDPEQAVIPLCRKSGISQIVWSPLAQGVLTGKYKPGAPHPSDSRATNASMGAQLPSRWLEAKVLEAVQALQPLADEAGLTIAQFCLAWVLREGNVAAAVIGASRPEQVDENAAAAEANVSSDLFARAEAIIDRAL